MDEVYWDHFTNEYRRFARTGHLNNKVLLNILMNYIKGRTVMDIADVGCAAGSLYYHLKDTKINYYGFELSENSIKAAYDIYPEISVYPFDIRTDKIRDQFDIVYSSEMLSHIRLKYLWDSIVKLEKAANKVCMLSMKFGTVKSFEFEAKHPKKNFTTPYVCPNIIGLKSFFKRFFKNVTMSAILFADDTTWKFLRGTEYAGKTGNLIVIIDKESEDNKFEFKMEIKTKW